MKGEGVKILTSIDLRSFVCSGSCTVSMRVGQTGFLAFAECLGRGHLWGGRGGGVLLLESQIRDSKLLSNQIPGGCSCAEAPLET